ncbi:MAG: hypothetical protein ACOVQX_07190 [Legionella sp.]
MKIKDILCLVKAFILLWFWLASATVQAGEPLWSIVPAPGSYPSQPIPENDTVTVTYVVENQSTKPKQLVMQAIPGIEQPKECQLAPKGQYGSSCILSLVITGKKMPVNGIHGGPVLCQANANGSANPNQCYQPTGSHVLQLKRSAPTTTTITATADKQDGSLISLTSGDKATITVKNDGNGNTVAKNIQVTVQNNNYFSVTVDRCQRSLEPGKTCSIELTANQTTTAHLPSIEIAGENTNKISFNIEVKPKPEPMVPIIVTPASLTLTAGGTGGITVRNDSDSTAENIKVDISNVKGITLDSNTCTSLGRNNTCQFSLKASDQPTSGSGTITVKGDNTAPVTVNISVINPPKVLEFKADGPPLILNKGDKEPSRIIVTNIGSTAVSIKAVIDNNLDYVRIVTEPDGFEPRSTCLTDDNPLPQNDDVCYIDISGLNPTAKNDSKYPNPILRISGTTDGVETNSISYTIIVEGNAIISAKPDKLSFIDNNSKDKTQTVSITNQSSITVNNIGVTIGGGYITAKPACQTLAPKQTCDITFTLNSNPETETTIPIIFKGDNSDRVEIVATVHPVATVSVEPIELGFADDYFGELTITNQSVVEAKNIKASFDGALTAVLQIDKSQCDTLAANQSCRIGFTAKKPLETNEVVGTVTIQGDNTYPISPIKTTITSTSSKTSEWSINPKVLKFSTGDCGKVTITNTSKQPISSYFIPAIPKYSHLETAASGYNDLCTSHQSLWPDKSCNIVFCSKPNEKEVDTYITINSLAYVKVTVADQPSISITSPKEDERILEINQTPLKLTITNDDEVVTAKGVTVETGDDGKVTGCPYISVDDSNCKEISPKGSCSLVLTTDKPYKPCTIAIKGSNTLNKPTTKIATKINFGSPDHKKYGLVYDENNGKGKAFHIMESPLIWISYLLKVSTDEADGRKNSKAIIDAILKINSKCPSTFAACACQGLSSSASNLDDGPEVYLPAPDELKELSKQFCMTASSCKFGLKTSKYWTSHWENNYEDAFVLDIPYIPPKELAKDYVDHMHDYLCVRDFDIRSLPSS